ncbi:MAG: hypothetical protein WD535_05685 [Thermaerobacterales bacterium]
MVYRGFHLGKILLLGAFTLLVLFGAGKLYEWRSIERPLQETLAGRPDVVSVELTGSGRQLEATVLLGDVSNLRESYVEIQKSAADISGDGAPDVRVQDRRTAQLIDDYYALHYFIHEAATRGNFSQMAEALERAGAARGLDRTVFYVDEERIYLQLHRGAGYLYEVLQRAKIELREAGRGGRL